MKFQSFVNFPKKIKEIIKVFSHFLFFYLLSWSLFFSDFTFYKEALCFIIFKLSVCSNKLTLENIFEYIRQKWRKKTYSFQNFIPEWSVYTSSFFSFFFSHPCLFDRDEFIPGWNFISTKTCKHWDISS